MNSLKNEQSIKSLVAGSAVVSESELPQSFPHQVTDAAVASSAEASEGSRIRRGYGLSNVADDANTRGYGGFA